MLRVGLTGGIGAGKSAVAALLAARGAVVIDADQLAREVVEPETDGFGRVVAAFGPKVVGPDGRLDRPRLAEIVFNDPARLATLNAIVHPRVAARTAELAASAPENSVLVVDVPLLVENHLEGAYDVVLVVDAPDDVRIARLTGPRGLTEVGCQGTDGGAGHPGGPPRGRGLRGRQLRGPRRPGGTGRRGLGATRSRGIVIVRSRLSAGRRTVAA